MNKFYRVTVFNVFGNEYDELKSDCCELDLYATSYEKAEVLLLDLLNEYGRNNLTWDWESEVAAKFK